MANWDRTLERLAVWLVCALIAPLVLATTAGAQALYAPGTIASIDIRGNARVTDDNLRAVLPISAGDAFDPVTIDAGIKALFATGQFSDVRMTREGSVLVINVLENIVLNIVTFEDNTSITDDVLAGIVESESREIFTRSKVQSDVRRLLAVYRSRGMYSVNITPKLIMLDQNRANLVFEILEGAAAKIDTIVFVGNRQYSDGELRNAITSRQRAPWRFFSDADTYNPDRLSQDGSRLEAFYQNRGYADFKVISQSGEQITDRSGFLVTFVIDEGRRYEFGTSTVRSEIGGVEGRELTQFVKARPGRRYDRREIDETRTAISEELQDRGFAFAQVRVEQDRDPRTGIANLTYVLEEGEKVFVERIDIRGNQTTLDETIRREFRLAEGDAFSISALRRTQERLRALGYFDSVNINTLPGSAPDRTIIEAEVEEGRMNAYDFGARISSDSGIEGTLGVSYGNLGGRGQTLSLNTVLAQTTQSVSVSFTEPWLFGQEVPASVSAFYTRDVTPSNPYSSNSFGGRVSLGYKLSERLSQNWSYNLRRTSLFDVEPTAPLAITEEAGVTWRSIVGHSLSYDRRDNAARPREGFLLSMNNNLAGIGGDVAYLQNIASANYYIPVREQSSLAFLASAGHIVGLGMDTRTTDRFFFGEDMIRGFAPNGLTPVCDAANSGGDCLSNIALGGTKFYRGSAEFRWPFPLIGEQGFTGRFFADVGAVWDVGVSNLTVPVLESAEPRWSVGVGATWFSPFGPLSVDYGIPFNVQEGDVVNNFRFSVAGGF